MAIIENADAPEVVELKHSSAITDGSQPIRGGVPIVFPQFGNNGPVTQKHGFARNTRWQHVETKTDDESGEATGVFKLTWSEETYAQWPFKFEIIYAITAGFTHLRSQVKIVNLDDKPIDFNFLFHTYFHTDNLEKTYVSGLKDLVYTDQVGDKSTQSDRAEVVAFPEEIDRIYNRNVHDKKADRNRSEELLAIGDGGNCDVTIRSVNLYDCVVWNPGKEKAETLPDLHEDAYKEFVCVEPGNVLQKTRLEPNEAFECGQHLVLRILSQGSSDNRRKQAEKALKEFPQRKVNPILPAKGSGKK